MTTGERRIALLTAGPGTRLGPLTEGRNKGLLSVDNEAVVSHLLDRLPNVPVVVALGHCGVQVRQYLEMAHPDREFVFREVDYTGPKASSGYSLWQLRDLLPGPFLFATNDTVIEQPAWFRGCNWVGVSRRADTEKYTGVTLSEGRVTCIYRKGEPGGQYAYIGLAEIHDTDDFWASLGKKFPCSDIEGLYGLDPLYADSYTWMDTGDEELWRGSAHLRKPGQDLYFRDSRVIKFFADPKQVRDRVARAEVLAGLVPEVVESNDYFFAYEWVNGMPLSPADTVQFLNWCERNLWEPREATHAAKRARYFYARKTKHRLKRLFAGEAVRDRAYTVNGVPCPRAWEMVDRLGDSFFDNTRMVRWHGDLHPTNVLRTGEGYTLLDWRADYAGLLEAGDQYYDLAKLHHGLLVDHEWLDDLWVDVQGNEAEIDFVVPYQNLRALSVLERWVRARGLSVGRVRTIAALVCLNSSPLHHYPYNQFLYFLGTMLLQEALCGKRS